MKKITIMGAMGFLLLSAILGYTQNASDYLILESIGDYHNSGKGKCGKGSGVIAATGHFKENHDDLTCRTGYYNAQDDLAVSIQVTKHAGSESDKWLLHEVEDGYRSDEVEKLGLPTKGVRLRQIGGSNFISLRGSGYSWISNNVVVEISYTDLYGTKPEPLEVVQAYLHKFPSTISGEMVLDRAHTEQWIKDELDRRLWLCDKWFLQVQMNKVQMSDALRTIVKCLNGFLDYREKYYGVNSKDEKLGLYGYFDKGDGTSIKNKLTEYKNWWNVNKARSISLP